MVCSRGESLTNRFNQMSKQRPLHTVTDKELYKEGATIWLPIFVAVFVLFTIFSDGKKNYGEAVFLGSLSAYGLTSLAIFGKNISAWEREREMKKVILEHDYKKAVRER